MNEKIGMLSLGCSKNTVDTEMILGMLSRKGYQIINDENQADCIIINTCAFIESAKQEAIDTILEMAQYKREGKCKLIIVVGCLAQRYKEDIKKEIPEVDIVVTIDEYKNLGSIIDNFFNTTKINNIMNIYPEHFYRLRTTPQNLAYIKIAEGCSNRCTYCIIPSIRGPYKSREFSDIIEEAKKLAQEGVKEIILIAQDTTRYGTDLYGKTRLAELLNEISKIDNIKWVRFLYSYVDEINDELINTIKNNEKVCNYIDLPIQHISDTILEKMNRRGNSHQITSLINKLRELIPDVVIRTSLIVGFPGETQNDFNKLLKFVEETKFDKLGVFEYSPEEDTQAINYENQIDDKVKKERLQKIMTLQKKISKSKNTHLIGQSIDSLVEYESRNNYYIGRTYRDAPDIDGNIYIKSSKKLELGDIVKVNITKCSDYDLFGDVIS
jgi:ribosomal protein S12 methylthiotransferase